MRTGGKVSLAILILGMGLTACAPAATPAPPRTMAPVEQFIQQPPEAPVMPTPAPVAAATAVIYNTGAGGSVSEPQAGGRMIVKNADIRLLVANTDNAIDRVTQVASDVSGYIISSRVWYQDIGGVNFKYASYTIGVPVDQFERALGRLRAIAVRVTDETASGEDVTDQYVDLQSQLTNLEATRDRIRQFLDKAKTVEEALQVNSQLSAVEAQIEQTKGRMNYFSERSAYSTISITLEPDVASPTATLTPTPTATATPEPWKPGRTFSQAKDSVTFFYRGFADFAIWLGVAIVPIFGPFVLIGIAIWYFGFRRRRTPPAEKGGGA